MFSFLYKLLLFLVLSRLFFNIIWKFLTKIIRCFDSQIKKCRFFRLICLANRIAARITNWLGHLGSFLRIYAFLLLKSIESSRWLILFWGLRFYLLAMAEFHKSIDLFRLSPFTKFMSFRDKRYFIVGIYWFLAVALGDQLFVRWWVEIVLCFRKSKISQSFHLFFCYR